MQKNLILLVCLIVSSLVHAQVTFHADDLETIVNGERKSHEGKFMQTELETTSDYDVKWYRCSWNIDPAIRQISGSVTTLFVPLRPGFDSLVFDLSGALTVDSATYHKHPLSWDHAADLLTIRFTSALPQENSDSVTVYYHGVPVDEGSSSFTQSTHGVSPVVWTFSEPYGASDWWPCKNGLTDKADSIDIFIRTDAAYTAASNGILVSVTPDGAARIYHWKHRYPVAAYLVCLAVTNYARYSQEVPFDGDTLKVINYIYPEDSVSAASQTWIIVPMIQLFDSLFGIYPFQAEKYGHAEWGVGGGMEHQTMTFVDSFGFELLAHELAHQWFGDKVTCGSWTDIWLNEGFATYLSGLCYEHLSPDLWTRFREVRVEKIISKPGGSVYCPDTTDLSRIFDGRLSYAKGCMILHQLRWIFGDSVFFSAMNNYLRDVSLAYGFARTENFKAHFESSCKEDLTWYFDDWFTGEGYPSYQVRWSQTGDTVAFSLSQTQSSPSVSFFEMPVQLMFKNAARDTLIRVSNTFSGQEFTVTLPFKVDSAIFDPYCEIISGNNIVNAIAGHEPEAGLQVCPNPATNKLLIVAPGKPGKGTAVISDMSGREILRVEVPAGRAEINISKLPAGAYFVRFMTGGKTGTARFIKQ